MNLDRIAVLRLVASQGGYARAARSADYPITQSALHQQVRKLEAEIGCELLERIGKDSMRPTPAGRRLLEFVEPFLRDLPMVVRELREGRAGSSLAIHAESLLIRQLLPGWLHDLRARHPEAVIHLQEIPEPDLEPLRRTRTDAVLAHFTEVPTDVATITVAELRPFVVLPRDGAPRRITATALRELAERTFLAYPVGSRQCALQMEALAMRGIRPAHVMHLDTADLILGFVESGLGWSVVPSLAAGGPSGPRLLAIPLRRPQRTFPVQLAWRKDAPEHALLDALIECALPRTRRRRDG